jgi:chromosome segregation ATPase
MQKMKKMKPPTDTEEMIEYLMQRLEVSEEAIVEAENCISNERAKRIQLKNELQEKNDDLRKIVEGEKKTLQDKVHAELEKTLNAAIQAKVKAEEELKHKTNECKERDMMCEELDHQVAMMRAQTVRMKEMEQEASDMTSEIEQLRNENKSYKEDNSKLNEEIEECTAVIKKLDEARYTLNRLLGPNGTLNERERKKFLKQRGEEEEYDMGDPNNASMGRTGADAGGVVNNASRNMLGSNNDYFFNDQQNKEGQGDDDDFWYGAPKGGAYEQPAMGGAGYQSYIGNTQPVDPSTIGKNRSNKGSALKYRR